MKFEILADNTQAMSNLAQKLAGRFIVLDGPDGAGKSTQLALLASWLCDQGVRTVVAVDPGGTAIGRRIRPGLRYAGSLY